MAIRMLDGPLAPREFRRNVESILYPQLSVHTRKLTELWCEEEKRKIEGSGAGE